MTRIIKLYPKNVTGKVALMRWASNPMKDMKVKEEEDPFHIVLIPKGQMGELLSMGDLDDHIPSKGLPKKIQSGVTKFVGVTFRKFIEDFLAMVICRSQRIKRSDYEVTIE